MKIDLHLHTTYSDGGLTPKQVIKAAKEKGLCAIAITDHDECKGCIEAAEEKDIIVICGIELSADYHGEAHVLGYNIDCSDKGLIEHIEMQNASRKKRAVRMIEKFEDAGIELTMQEVMDECKGDVLGRPHIADALIKKGVVNSTKQAFVQYLDRNAKCYVPRDKVDIKQAAQLISAAGGQPVLAHPGLLSGTVWNELSVRLKEFGFWGIEAYHPAHSLGQCRELESFAKQNGLFVTCGSDFHGSAKPGIEIGQERRGGEYLKRSIRQLGIEC